MCTDGVAVNSKDSFRNDKGIIGVPVSDQGKQK
jgi:hypothetical protein